jgi:hypothetical protein
LEVMIGLDLSEGARSALEWTAELRHLGACNVTVAHIAWPLEQARAEPLATHPVLFGPHPLVAHRPIPFRFQGERSASALRDANALPDGDVVSECQPERQGV